MMTGPALDPIKMNRLAFVRMLYLQAVEQSEQPRPLSAASVLTFHDVAEQFLILAVEHLRAGEVRRDGGLLQYWPLLKPRRGFSQGVELSGQHGISRLNRVRNDLKHLGALPSQEDIDDARSAITSFLEDNTFKVFSVEFAEIDLADQVPQEEVRQKLRAAAAAEVAGDRKEAMANLVEAVANLLDSSQYKFGQVTVPPAGPLVGPTVGRLAARFPYAHQRRAAREAAANLDRHVQALSSATAAMQRGLRLLALGIDYAQYLRFEELTPHVINETGVRWPIVHMAWAPARQEYDDCVQFVITVALRFAEVEARAAPPSWRLA